jgi:hypothetical protein
MNESLTRIARLSAILVFLLCATGLSAQTYDVVSDFNTTANPNGVWTYQYNSTAYTLGQVVSNFAGSGLSAWFSNNGIPNDLYIAGNKTGSTISVETIVLPINTLWMDPESGTVDIKFTAPHTGSYSISGVFSGIDTGENSPLLEVLDDGTILWSGTVSSWGATQSFNFLETLHTGDNITFLVGQGSSGSCVYCNLSTGLQADITATPEPPTVFLFLGGLLWLIVKSLRPR